MEIYGKYYKVREGWKAPQPVTIINLETDDCMFVWGHFEKDEINCDEKLKDLCLSKNSCRLEKIIETLTDEQRKFLNLQIRAERRDFEKTFKAVEAFKAEKRSGGQA